MSEALETQSGSRRALAATHEQLGARMINQEGTFVPANYGDVLGEYHAVRDAAGIIDLSSRGRILVSGSEAIQFLNGLVTNDMKTLADNTWMPAAFPNVQGRLIASVRIAHLKERDASIFLIDTEAATHERVVKEIKRFTLAGDFHVEDISSETVQLSLQGKNAQEIINSALNQDASALVGNGVIKVAWRGQAVTVLRGSHTSEDGFDLVAPASDAARLWEELVKAGAKPVGFDALEILRIESGVPLYNVDMNETNVVTETALDDAVSYTKGCYVGQEIIARIKYRGHVAKKLVGLLFDPGVTTETGAMIESVDGKEIGRITSITQSPRLGRSIALGYLKFDFLAAGTKVKIASGKRQASAVVTELPFVRGSWYENQPKVVS